MALNRQRYTVDKISPPAPRFDAAGRLRYVVVITITIGDRHVSTIEVPAVGLSKESAAAAIEAEVERISQIYSLGSS